MIAHTAFWGLLIVLVGCSSDDPGADAVASTPTSIGVTTTAGAPDLPSGFERVAATAVAADGTVCELCLWLADTPPLRSLGLMSVDEIGDADGMIFRYDAPTDSGFWMKNTRIPLSIAFFDDEGKFVDALDMEPCTELLCPTYTIDEHYVDAIEVPHGMLDDLAIGEGTTLTVTALPCQ